MVGGFLDLNWARRSLSQLTTRLAVTLNLSTARRVEGLPASVTNLDHLRRLSLNCRSLLCSRFLSAFNDLQLGRHGIDLDRVKQVLSLFNKVIALFVALQTLLCLSSIFLLPLADTFFDRLR